MVVLEQECQVRLLNKLSLVEASKFFCEVRGKGSLEWASTSLSVCYQTRYSMIGKHCLIYTRITEDRSASEYVSSNEMFEMLHLEYKRLRVLYPRLCRYSSVQRSLSVNVFYL